MKHIKIITDYKLTFQNQKIDQSELLVSSILYKSKAKLFMKNYLKCEQRQMFELCESIGKAFWENLLNICENC